VPPDPTRGGLGAAKPAEGTPKASEAPPAKPGEGANQNPGQKPGASPAEKSAQQPAAEPRLASILGREVTNRDGDAGRVIDVLVDHDGHLGAVVVEFGGFMGIGSRKVAVDWSALRFRHEGNHTSVVVDISREQIRDAGEYKPNEPSVLTPK
jgi:hypothetical protein